MTKYYMQYWTCSTSSKFSHPVSDKLLKFLKLAKPWKFNKRTRNVLEYIFKRCNPCQIILPGSIRFCVPIPEEKYLVFGGQLSLYLMFVDGKAMLHVVDTATHLFASVAKISWLKWKIIRTNHQWYMTSTF